MRMVEESQEPGASVSLVARHHGVSPNQLFTWRRLAAHGALAAAAAGEWVVPVSDYRALQEQIRELHHLLGKKTLEAEILREALQHADPKKMAAVRAVAATGRFPVKAVAGTLGTLQPGGEGCRHSPPRASTTAGGCQSARERDPGSACKRDPSGDLRQQHHPGRCGAVGVATTGMVRPPPMGIRRGS